MVDTLPDVDATELRIRLEDTVDIELDDAWAIKAGSWIDALAGSRRAGDATDIVYQPGEIYARYRHARFDLTAGFQRIVWGTLDEIQPTDVINPIDLSRFVFEGRSEARLPVLAMRARLFLPHETTVDAVYVPFFRRGRYDLLDEPTSPFNLLARSMRRGRVRGGGAGDLTGESLVAIGPGGLPRRWTARRAVPANDVRGAGADAGNGSVGARASRAVGGIDVGVSVWRGWQPFPLVSPEVRSVSGEAVPGGAMPGVMVVLRESWSRVTMVGADAEAARGAITWRAEGALFADTVVQERPGGIATDGRSLQVGAGLDWTVGPWRTFGNVIARRAWATGADAVLVPASGGVQLVGGAERTFARETRLVRGFAVVDPTEGTAFVRGLGAWNLRDNLWLEASAAWFTGDGDDFLGQYTDRDFVSLRVKYHF